MKTPCRFNCLFLAFLFVANIFCRHSQQQIHKNFIGKYQEVTLPSDSTSRVLLQIKKLDHNAYVFRLKSNTAIAKEKNGFLSGELKSYSGVFPFTFELTEDTIGILRISDKTVEFVKIETTE